MLAMVSYGLRLATWRSYFHFCGGPTIGFTCRPEASQLPVQLRWNYDSCIFYFCIRCR